MDRARSAQLFETAKKYFPGGVNSPVRAFKSVTGPPLFIEQGEGCRITSVDGHQYLDFCGSWGPLILGHSHPAVIEKVVEVARRGTSFGAPTALGNELGALIVEQHRYIEQIRFVSSGTEAVMSAIRLARGYTGRPKVVKFEGCYHGHVDSMLVKAGSGLATFGVSTSAGVPESFIRETIVLPLDDVHALEQVLEVQGSDIAAVIIEPIPANNGLLLQTRGYLQKLRELCTKHQVVLIFDEVISGFRVGFEGAAAHYGVPPDIITFGKIIGGGLPVGAFAASREIMSHVSPDGPVYQAGTLSANPVAMAAGIATLRELSREGFYQELQAKTEGFVDQLSKHCEGHDYPVAIHSVGSIFWIAFARHTIRKASDIDPASMDHFKHLHAALLDKGVYLGPSGYEVGFVSAAHTQADLQEASDKICQSMDEIFA